MERTHRRRRREGPFPVTMEVSILVVMERTHRRGVVVVHG